MSENLYEKLRATADKAKERTCLRSRDELLTYGDLFQLANRVAAVLDNCELNPGDRVVAQCGKAPLTLALYLACLQRGLIYVPLNTSYTRSELRYFLEDAQASVYVGTDLSDSQSVGPEHEFTLRDDGTGSLADTLQQTDAQTKSIEPRSASDVAAILYTSGTTGLSKGAMLTHGNLLSNAVALNQVWGFTHSDVLLHALPIYHVHGLFVAIHCVLLSNCSMLFHSRFAVEDVIRDLPDSTVLMGVPTFYTRLLASTSFTSAVVSNMRLFISGSAPLTEQTFNQFKARTGHLILERYGMSETLMNTSNPLRGERKAGTVGYALPGIELRIANEDGVELAPGQVGGIELKGPNVFSGYWRKPEKTSREFRSDGYFMTGDMGVQSEDGRVSIVGREKDLVISGGLNVYPSEVESAIGDHPDVEDVAVIGAPHADLGEGVVAVIVSKSCERPSRDSMRAFLRDRLAGFKLPQAVVRIDELPRNAMGKVQKKQLREQFADLFDELSSTS